MTRETRYNLIFLAVILLLLVPGAVLLFISRLHQTAARPMSAPVPAPRTIAYMSPNAIPPGMHRVAPPHTLHWVQSVARDKVGAGAWDALLCPTGEDDLPLMSARHAFQVIAMRRDHSDLAVWVMFWNKAPSENQQIWTLGADNMPLVLADSQNIPIPHLVRDEMGENQIFIPPKNALVQKILVPQQSADNGGELVASTIELHARLKDGTTDFATIPIPANAPSTTHYVEDR
jgi:hypothetical protein